MKKKQKSKKTALPEETADSGKKHFIALSILIISIVLAYSNSINGTWAMDDVVANKPVNINDLHDLLGFRKVAYITFLLNQSLAPFSPAYFRLFNIFIHILNSVLVYVLAYRTMILISGVPGPQAETFKQKDNIPYAPDKKAFFTAVLSSLIFALHPLNINAVAYIVQRMASLSTLFVLLSLLSYIAARQAPGKLQTALLYVLSGICVIIGIFSKENAVMVIPLILLYDYVFLSGFNTRTFLKRLSLIAFIGILSIGTASYFLGFHTRIIELSDLFLSPNQPIARKDWMAIDVYWTPLQHVITEFRVLSRYMFLILLPLPGFLVFDWWGFPLSHGVTEPITTLLSLALVISLLLFSLLKIKQYPLLCSGVLWYFTAISLESFFALGTDFYFEHRNYLPLTGLIIGVTGHAVSLSGDKLKEKRIWVITLFACMVLGSLTYSRNFIWKDSVTLWGDTLKKTPSNIRAMMALGNANMKVAETDNAEKYYKEAVKKSSADKRIYFLNEAAYNLGMLYLQGRKIRQAKELIDEFAHNIDSYKPTILKGFYKSLNNNIDGAISDYNKIIEETQGVDRVVVFTLLGDAYREKGLLDTAIENYNKALFIDPGFSSAYYGIGASYMGKKDLNSAHDFLGRALAVDPHHMLALSDMADLMLMESKPQKALEYAKQSVSKSPPYYQPYLTMGNVLFVIGQENKAEGFFTKAIEHGMAEYMVPFSKARAYYMKGEKEKAQHYILELKRYKDLPEKIKDIVE